MSDSFCGLRSAMKRDQDSRKDNDTMWLGKRKDHGHETPRSTAPDHALQKAIDDVETWGGWIASAFSSSNPEFVELIRDVGAAVGLDPIAKVDTGQMQNRLSAIKDIKSNKRFVESVTTLLGKAAQAQLASPKIDAMGHESKFGAVEEANFGDAESFFNGIERLIGKPQLDLMVAVQAEHMNDDEYVAPNYKVRTTPRLEWANVFGNGPQVNSLDPETKPRLWKDINWLYSNMVTEMNKKREMFGMPLVTVEEVKSLGLLVEEVGCLRLYTGPMFVKYNTILRERGKGKEVPRLYTTTLHLISSGLIKLSRLQPSVKLYRGFGGGRFKMPQRFFTKHPKFNTLGGVEFAFMSCTQSRDVAMEYSGGGYLFELTTGMTTRGADLSWISFYPEEMEVCLPPCTALEVLRKSRMDGQAVIMDMIVVANPAAATIEKFLEQRKSVVLELSEIVSDGAGGEVAQEVLYKHSQHLGSETHRWFNIHSNFATALQGLLDISRAGQQEGESLESMLMFALRTRALEATAALCRMGADPTATTKSVNTTPLNVCISENYTEGFEAVMAHFTLPSLNLSKLKLGTQLTDSASRSLVQGLLTLLGTQPRHLTSLCLGHLNLSAENVTLVLSTTIDVGRSLSSLSQIDLSNNTIENAPILTRLGTALNDSTVFPALKRLSLGNCHITDLELVVLLATSCVSRGTVLTADTNDDLTAWLEAPVPKPPRLATTLSVSVFDVILLGVSLHQLTELDVREQNHGSSTTCDFDVVVKLMDAHRLSGSRPLTLSSLTIQGHLTSDEGAKTLADSEFMHSITSLNLANNSITTEGSDAIAASAHLPALRSLDLSGNNLKDNSSIVQLASSCAHRGIALRSVEKNKDLVAWIRHTPRSSSFATSKIMAGQDVALLGASMVPLKELKACDANADVSQLVESYNAAGSPILALETLTLRGNNVRDSGLIVLLGIAGLTSLTALDLSDNKITDAGVAELVGSALGQTLKSIELANNAITAQGLASIASVCSQRISSLGVAGNHVFDEGLAALVAHQWPALTHLSIENNGISGIGITSFVQSNSTPQLTSLALSHNIINSEGVQAIASSENLRLLTSLLVSHNSITDQGAHAIAASPHLTLLTHLNLASNGITAEGMTALASSQNLAGVKNLDVSLNPIGIQGTEAIAQSTILRQLKQLNLGTCNIASAGASALFASDVLSTVEILVLNNNTIGAAGAAAFAASNNVRALVNLNLAGNTIAVAGAKSLFASENMSRVTILDISVNAIGDRGVEAFTTSAHACNLTQLNLANNSITKTGAKSLAASENLRSLTLLNLEQNVIGFVGGTALFSSGRLPMVRDLNVAGNHIGSEGVEVLFSSPASANLESVNLSKNSIGISGAKAIASSPNARGITQLNLSSNNIGEDGACALAESTTLDAVASLSLECSGISARGLKALVDSAWVATLSSLDVSRNVISDEGASAIAASTQMTNLRSLNLNACKIKTAGFKELFASSNLKNLASLSLNESPCFGYDCVGFLSASEQLPALRELSASKCRISTKTSEDLINWAHLKHIKTLGLGNNNIGNDGIAKLGGESTNLQCMELLDINNSNIYDKGIEALTTRRGITNLNMDGNDFSSEDSTVFANSILLLGVRHLSLQCNRLRPAGVAALSQSPYIKDLLSLNLSNNSSIGSQGIQDLVKVQALACLTDLALESTELGAEGASAIAASCSVLRSVTRLNLASNEIGDDGAKALAAATPGLSLVTLDLGKNKIKVEGMTALAGCKYLNTLTVLNLEQNGFGDEGAAAVANSENFQNLTTLNVSWNEIRAAGATAIANSDHLHALTSLTLDRNEIDKEGGLALAASPHLRVLTKLSLMSSEITDEGIVALVNSPICSSLTYLHIGRNGLSNAGAQALCTSPYVNSLTTLYMYGFHASTKALSEFMASDNVRTLTCLDMSSHYLGPEGAAALVAGKLQNLIELEIAYCKIGDDGAVSLVGSDLMCQLQVLSLCGNEITSRGGRALAECNKFPVLRFLNIEQNTIDLEGARAFASSRNFPSLANMYVGKNHMGEEGPKLLMNSTALDGVQFGGLQQQEQPQQSFSNFAQRPGFQPGFPQNAGFQPNFGGGFAPKPGFPPQRRF